MKRGPADMSIDGTGTARARCVLAPNPSPMTLDGTNTWMIAEPGSAQAVVVDPGPDDESHLRRVYDQVTAAGQRITRILLTHSHPDHAEGAATFAEMTGAPVLAADPAYRLGLPSPPRRPRPPHRRHSPGPRHHSHSQRRQPSRLPQLPRPPKSPHGP